MENFTERTRAQLEQEFQGWVIYVITRAVGGQIWCAMREGEDTAALNASSPAELAGLLRSAGQGP